MLKVKVFWLSEHCYSQTFDYIHTESPATCAQSKFVCAAVPLLHCSTTSNTHTYPNMLLLCVKSMFLCACSSYLLLHTASRYPPLSASESHFAITAATGGLFSENPHFLASSANRHHLLPSLFAFASSTVQRAREA